ncbi:hypothetical protein PDJAM_G00261760 [Pangasius djambal]|nr:hypothetical protein [Pangasius djambal]
MIRLGSCSILKTLLTLESSASESKREQFRRYLEKAGVLDSLTNVLVALYEETEKPSNALEYPSRISHTRTHTRAHA